MDTNTFQLVITLVVLACGVGATWGWASTKIRGVCTDVDDLGARVDALDKREQRRHVKLLSALSALAQASLGNPSERSTEVRALISEMQADSNGEPEL